MIFWLWNVLAMAVMMAVLSLMVEYKGGADVLVTPTAMMISVLLTLLICTALVWQMARAAPKRYLWRGVRAATLLGLFGLSLGLFGLRAYQVYQHDAIIRPTSPMQVQATVEIHELSDGIYDKAYEDKAAGLSYRQKAVIRDIQPLGSSDTQADAMTVLLYAKAAPRDVVSFDELAILSSLKVGQQAVMTLQIKPLVSQRHYGFDGYRWLLGRHVHATADIISVESGSIRPLQHLSLRVRLQQARAYYRELFYKKWQQAPWDKKQALAVTLSLLTGDRALIDNATYELYRYGGIMHLLAISGAHVLFLAVLLASLVVRTVQAWLPFLYYYIARWQLRFLVMVAAALLYALFVGFEVPAMRTVLMLVVAGVARWLLLGWSSLKVLAISAMAMAYHDPYVLWQAGFWLSVVAVAVLLRYEMAAIEGGRQHVSLRTAILSFIKLQLYVFVAMLPISVLLFGQVSAMGALINLVAVGLFGWLIVPLNLLAGLAAIVSSEMAWLIWQALAALLASLATGLAYCKLLFGESWLAADLSVAVLLLFALVAILIKGDWLSRRFAWLPLMAAVLAMMQHQKTQGIQVVVLEDASSSQVLLRHNDSSWLVMALHHRSLDEDKLADWLYRTLKQQGVSRLDGIIIQDDNQKLLFATTTLATKLPVAAVWWAGDERQIGQLPIRHCKADISLAWGEGQIRFLTGWQDIPLPDCAVIVQSEQPSQIKAHLPKGVVDLAYQNTALVIDNNQHSDTWALYELLCQNNEINSVNVLLAHSQSTLPSAVYEHFGRPKLVFNHVLTTTQQQSALLLLRRFEDR